MCSLLSYPIIPQWFLKSNTKLQKNLKKCLLGVDNRLYKC
nr:MAG TPA: hypothetical protein [Caudoviricetes sp.]DAM10685.1 MAG TPA: hypothetical protein [Caudoviricetes sp.]